LIDRLLEEDISGDLSDEDAIDLNGSAMLGSSSSSLYGHNHGPQTFNTGRNNNSNGSNGAAASVSTTSSSIPPMMNRERRQSGVAIMDELSDDDGHDDQYNEYGKHQRSFDNNNRYDDDSTGESLPPIYRSMAPINTTPLMPPPTHSYQQHHPHQYYQPQQQFGGAIRSLPSIGYPSQPPMSTMMPPPVATSWTQPQHIQHHQLQPQVQVQSLRTSHNDNKGTSTRPAPMFHAHDERYDGDVGDDYGYGVVDEDEDEEAAAPSELNEDIEPFVTGEAGAIVGGLGVALVAPLPAHNQHIGGAGTGPPTTATTGGAAADTKSGGHVPVTRPTPRDSFDISHKLDPAEAYTDEIYAWLRQQEVTPIPSIFAFASSLFFPPMPLLVASLADSSVD
jgi:hypothetical protein